MTDNVANDLRLCQKIMQGERRQACTWPECDCPPWKTGPASSNRVQPCPECGQVGEHKFQCSRREGQGASVPVDAIPNRVQERPDEHWPGEPTAVQMLRDLQMAVLGETYATSWSPSEEWWSLIDRVKDRFDTHAIPNREAEPFPWRLDEDDFAYKAVCGICGSMVARSSQQLHEEWHRA